MYLRACHDEVVLARKDRGDSNCATTERGLCQGNTDIYNPKPSLTPISVIFQTFFSEASPQHKISALRAACQGHVKLTKECSQGFGQDRHLYALYCLLQRERESISIDERPISPAASTSSHASVGSSGECGGCGAKAPLPAIFTDPGWQLLSTSILSTSNRGNPALRLFGFGPVAADGYGIGYIIKDDGLSV